MISSEIMLGGIVFLFTVVIVMIIVWGWFLGGLKEEVHLHSVVVRVVIVDIAMLALSGRVLYKQFF